MEITPEQKMASGASMAAPMTPEWYVLWAAEHSLSMPNGLIVSADWGEAPPAVLAFADWRQLAAVSGALHRHFLRRVVPAFLKQLRHRVDDRAAQYVLPDWSSDVAGGSFITQCVRGWGSTNAVLDLFYSPGRRIGQVTMMPLQRVSSSNIDDLYTPDVAGRTILLHFTRGNVDAWTYAFSHVFWIYTGLPGRGRLMYTVRDASVVI